MTLKTYLIHHKFAFQSQTVNAIEKLLSAFYVQLKIGMNPSLIWLYLNATLLVTSHVTW